MKSAFQVRLYVRLPFSSTADAITAFRSDRVAVMVVGANMGLMSATNRRTTPFSMSLRSISPNRGRMTLSNRFWKDLSVALRAGARFRLAIWRMNLSACSLNFIFREYQTSDCLSSFIYPNREVFHGRKVVNKRPRIQDILCIRRCGGLFPLDRVLANVAGIVEFVPVFYLLRPPIPQVKF